MCISKDGDGVGTRDDVASSEATASEASASEVGGATAAKQPEQGGSEAANEEEEDRDVWRRRSLQASGNASQAEGVESSNEARRVAESVQVATATDAETGTFLFLVYLAE